MIKTGPFIILLMVFMLFGNSQAAIFEDFESGISPAKWTNDGNWTVANIDTYVAWSMLNGEAGTGDLASIEIAVPANGILNLRVNGHDGILKDQNGFQTIWHKSIELNCFMIVHKKMYIYL